MSLDLDAIREKLDEIEESYNDDDIYHPGRYDSHLLQYVPNDIAALIAEVERLRAALAATADENASLDRNLKDCVNFMRDLWPVIGVDLNALRLEPDRAAAIETVRRAVEDWGTDD